jgi:hypothetical protein
LERLFINHSLILSLPTGGEIGNAGSEPRNELLDPYLAKVSAAKFP